MGVKKVRRLELTNGGYVLVDTIDVVRFNLRSYQWHWTDSGKGKLYVRTYTGTKGVGVYLHRLLMSPPKGLEVDHANTDTFDNRRSNLRLCTRSQNIGNQRKTRGVSRFKGVSLMKKRGVWVAKIANRHLGVFRNEEDAARCYDDAALQLWGEYSRLNFPIDARVTELLARSPAITDEQAMMTARLLATAA